MHWNNKLIIIIVKLWGRDSQCTEFVTKICNRNNHMRYFKRNNVFKFVSLTADRYCVCFGVKLQYCRSEIVCEKSFDSLFFTHFMLNALFLLCNTFNWFKSAIIRLFVIIDQQSYYYHHVIVDLFFIFECITRNVCKWRSRDIDTYLERIWRFILFFTFIFLKRKRNI